MVMYFLRDIVVNCFIYIFFFILIYFIVKEFCMKENIFLLKWNFLEGIFYIL